MLVKIHKSYRNLVAICDSDLIGKKFEEKFEKGIKLLDLRESFYKGEEKTYKETIEIIKKQSPEDSTFSIVGKESIKAAKEAEIITKHGVKKIHGIPYALVLL